MPALIIIRKEINMRVCIYAAASDNIDKKYVTAVEKLSEDLAKSGHSLIYGGGASGLMGAAARGFRKGNGEVIGVAPKFMDKFEPIFEDCTEIIRTETMAERKKIMEDGCDAFIIVPGGIGTLDEFFQVLTLRELERHNKDIIIYNIDDFYTKLVDYIEDGIERGFIRPSVREYYRVVNISTK